MPLLSFLNENWILVALLAVVLVAIVIYEIRNRGGSGELISNITASQLINNGAILVDTRAHGEFKKGHIAGALSIPTEKFSEFLNKHEKKRDKTFVLYCDTGGHAKTQAQQMRNRGFLHISVLKAGIAGWRQDNLPTV